MNPLLGMLPFAFVGILAVVGSFWSQEATDLKANINTLTEENTELKYILSGKTTQGYAISELTASDYTPRLNQDVIVRFKINTLQDTREDIAVGRFAIDPNCTEYLRLDEGDNHYWINDGNYWKDDSWTETMEDRHTVRVVDMPSKDTTCRVNFTLTHETGDSEIDSRYIELKL